LTQSQIDYVLSNTNNTGNGNKVHICYDTINKTLYPDSLGVKNGILAGCNSTAKTWIILKNTRHIQGAIYLPDGIPNFTDRSIWDTELPLRVGYQSITYQVQAGMSRPFI
jgi:hypothetical protein